MNDKPLKPKLPTSAKPAAKTLKLPPKPAPRSTTGSRATPASLPKTQARSLLANLRVEKPEQIKTLQDLILHFAIPKEWDAILVTDGSATNWQNSGGWAGLLYRKTILEPALVLGAFNRATNNVAELMVVFQACLELGESDDVLKERGYQLHVISDSQYVVSGLNKLSEHGTIWASNTGANRPIWLGILGSRRRGIVLRAHYVPRDTIAPNKYCHDAANAARKALAKLKTDIGTTEQLAAVLPR